MSKVIEEKLLAGFIFGDNDNDEYIYLPGGEVGAASPCCVLERKGSVEDVPLSAAAYLVGRLSLRPCRHPLLGSRSY